jgi:hypothetical protein
MRENRPYGSEGGEGNLPDPYPRFAEEGGRLGNVLGALT